MRNKRGVKTIKMMVAWFFWILISAFQVKGFCFTGKREKISFVEQQNAEHDKELVGHVFHKSVTANPQQCYLRCINDCRCLSINYKERHQILRVEQRQPFYKQDVFEDFRYMKNHIFALRWRDEIIRSSQLRTLLKRLLFYYYFIII